MKEISIKKGVLLITYTQSEIDKRVEEFLETKDSDGCRRFLDELRSFNPKSSSYITIEEAQKYTSLEKKKNKINPCNLYANYKGNPFGIYINETKLLFKDPILSLKSAFEIGATDFNYDLDYFLPTITEE